MNTQPVIMVQIADRAWTEEALQYASALARKQSAEIVLLKLLPVQHLGWLGTDFGYISLTEDVQEEMSVYEKMLEESGVSYRVELFQYITLSDAIVQAAEQVNACVVFANLPKSIIPFWQHFQLEKVRYQLAEDHRELVEHPDDGHIPSAFALAIAAEQ